MINSQNPLLSDTYLISTNIRSFGFIISDTASRPSKGRNASAAFFEVFRFSPDVTKQIFDNLCSDGARTVFATDLRGQGFLFYSPVHHVKLFAFVKKLDINGNEAATIIREHLSDSIICINGKTADISHDGYRGICDTICNLQKLLLSCNTRDPDTREMQSSIQGISECFCENEINLELSELALGNKQGYIFSAGGFVLFLSFFYMTASKLGARNGVRLSLGGNAAASVIRAELNISDNDHEKIISKLDFLRDTMDAQNLTLFYTLENQSIKTVFLPYYIDDGLHGVKAPIEPLNYL